MLMVNRSCSPRMTRCSSGALATSSAFGSSTTTPASCISGQDALGDGTAVVQATVTSRYREGDAHRAVGKAAPRQLRDLGTQLGKVDGTQCRQSQQHAGGGAQVQVGAVQRCEVAAELDATDGSSDGAEAGQGL